jgi:hypothetical protein
MVNWFALAVVPLLLFANAFRLCIGRDDNYAWRPIISHPCGAGARTGRTSSVESKREPAGDTAAVKKARSSPPMRQVRGNRSEGHVGRNDDVAQKTGSGKSPPEAMPSDSTEIGNLVSTLESLGSGVIDANPKSPAEFGLEPRASRWFKAPAAAHDAAANRPQDADRRRPVRASKASRASSHRQLQETLNKTAFKLREKTI